MLVAAAVIAPEREVILIFIPIKMWVLAVGMFAIAVYAVITGAGNAGGEAAHIGGAIAGFALIKNPHLLNLFAPGAKKRFAGSMTFRDWSRDANH